MPISSDPSPTAIDLHRYFEMALPDASISEVEIPASLEPLIFLQTKRTVAAFALAESNARESYDILYPAFKKHCTDSRSEWDALDLVFVFCVRSRQDNFEQFCSAVETDVYFCRKFVLQLGPQIEMALARLPFLPLMPLRGMSMRPPSAQTLLQQSGVPSTLARNLVVQRERGAEGIVDDCLGDLFGVPSGLTLIADLPPSAHETHALPVHLKTVTIQNFRAYRKAQTFKIGSDVTILYGPNGFGKTSFFDAVDFALTGGIARFSSSGEPQFLKTARHLDAGSEEGLVSVKFRSQTTDKDLIRKVSSRKQAQLDGSDADRKSVLTQLTGGNLASADRIENFVNLFRATHLFSQDQQELTKDFQSNCQLPSHIVSRMLAFEDYEHAVAKATAVRGILQDRIKRGDDALRDLSEQIANDQRELDRLARVANTSVNVTSLDAEAASLSQRLAAAGISIPTSSTTLEISTVRGWRAALETHQAQSQSRSNKLLTLASDVARYPQLNSEMATLKSQIELKEQALLEATRRQAEVEAELGRFEGAFNQITSRRIEEESRAVSLGWVRANQPAFVQMLQRQSILNSELQAAVEAISQARSEESATSDQKRQLDIAASEAATLSTTKNDELLSIKQLAELVEPWILTRDSLARLSASQTEQNAALSLLRETAQQLAEQQLGLKNQEARLNREILDGEASQSELRNLLSQLQTHVSSGICLACGDDHGTKEELLSRMQKFATADAATTARAQLVAIQESIRQVETDHAENKAKQESITLVLARLEAQKEQNNQAIRAFESLASTLAFAVSSASNLKAAIRSRQDAIQAEAETLSGRSNSAKQAVAAAGEKLRLLKAAVDSKVDEAAEKRVALALLEAELVALRDDPRQISVPLSVGPEQLEALIRTSEQELSERREEASRAENELSRRRPLLTSLKQEITGVRPQLAALRAQSATLQRTINEVETRFREQDIPLYVTEDVLQTKIASETRIQGQLQQLRDETSNLELALDAATTAAALTQLRQNLRIKETAATDVTAVKTRCEPWLRYFEGVIKLVGAEQNKAIANFTKAYGPRASVIQARLRSVYGFEDVEIQSHDAAINVRVKRRGEELRPTDYFSQSQQQTLLLALFLTASTSQTWSGFCPILLDDPVTHFDDLNVYSFLDLIAGLMESEPGRRQFIISTCDLKLMKLARQKFRNSQEAVVFYRFSDIGTEGPALEELTFA